MDEFGHGICSVCGRNELIKYKTKYGGLICCYCAERPSDAIMEKSKLYGSRLTIDI